MEYLLKWHNFDESHNKWVSKDQLQCGELLREFEKQYEANHRQKRARNERRKDVTNRSKRKKESKSSIVTLGWVPLVLFISTYLTCCLYFSSRQ